LVIHVVGAEVSITESSVQVTAGTNLEKLIMTCLNEGLAGMERMAGIPGSLGGAVRGNAGAFGAEIGEFVTKVKAVSRETGMVREFSKAECDFEYRQSFFKKNNEWVIVEAALSLTPGRNVEELLAIAKETKEKREAKHPQTAKCAGSFFMNPVVSDEKLLTEFAEEAGTPSKNGKLPAGWLITHVGLRGKQIGGAKISSQHPNYLVNTGSATAEDVIMLASLVKTRVRDELGVRLREEVQFVGF
jgi:UDP-N-acetylmuramate dehydrogenase